MIVSCDEMRAREKRAFASGVTADSLMEEAGVQIARTVCQFFPVPGMCVVFFGKGHNGGDALVAARHLATLGWRIELRSPFLESTWAELTAEKHKKFLAVDRHGRDLEEMIRGKNSCPFVVLDGLLGIGAHGPLRDPVLEAARKINHLRAESNAQVFSIDIPTGLDGDTGEPADDCVVADFTLAIGFAKKGLVADTAPNFVGRLAVLPLPKLDMQKPEGDRVSTIATGHSLAVLLPRRKFDSNKGNYGRIGIVAGSVGAIGAAAMSAEAALRAGAGLITLFAPPEIYAILASVCTPEIMVREIESYREVLDTKLDVIAVGPGLGKKYADDVLHLIEKSPLPMVVDADALNIISSDTSLLGRCAGKRLLTPHPGEMARLCETKNQSRHEIAQKFTEQFPVTLLLKGSRTIIAESGEPFSYNTTGSPGMATGGMGDTLTGVCAALIGQGLSCYDAARLGAWVCGRAAELAIYQGAQSEESLAATDLHATLGEAFKQLRAKCF
ncbi:MAG: NAD(P)H-hydrate dehydratase [Chthoniobacteraceae bacterium]